MIREFQKRAGDYIAYYAGTKRRARSLKWENTRRSLSSSSEHVVEKSVTGLRGNSSLFEIGKSPSPKPIALRTR